jgi:DedD protein
MDPALKQRMLGAAVLIVLAIIFVPMLLDGAPSGRSETVDLAIPDAPERDFETRVVPLDTAPPASVEDPNAVATVEATATKPVDALTGSEPPAPAAETEAEPQPAATVAPDVAPAPPAAQAATPGGRYAVSFGTYGLKANADKLVADLKAAQVAAYSDQVTVDGKPMLRVRAGPFVDRTQAEQARLVAKQARGDVAARVVEVDDTPAADAAPPTTAARVTGWAVQVGAYKAEAEAVAQRDKLRAGGYAAFVDPVRAAEGTLYRVRVGPEALRANAEKLRDALKSRYQVDGLVVTQP